MKSIVLFGAGRSSLYLIEYLQKWCVKNNCKLIVCDKDTLFAASNTKEIINIEFKAIDVFDIEKISTLIMQCELVVSLLPATMHFHIAKLCLQYNKNLATASYISPEMQTLHEEVEAKGLIFLNEIGLDPGIDHLSALKILDKLKAEGAEIKSFESYCGGLVADSCDNDNPWKYKFSWNPRNVILAGQGAPAQYKMEGNLKLIPYHQLFNHTKTFEIHNYGTLEGYPNRDSLKYIALYGLQNIDTMVRGTLRKTGYCNAWQVFVSLGLTDDNAILEFAADTTIHTWLKSYLPASNLDLKTQIKTYTHCTHLEIEKLEWLGFFTDEKLPICKGTSAQILEELLKIKWQLQAEDKDMVVMLHRIQYLQNETLSTILSSLIIEGKNNTHTAMSKTVGLPLAIACKLILENKVLEKGVLVPLTPEFYNPVLQELELHGIAFNEIEY